MVSQTKKYMKLIKNKSRIKRKYIYIDGVTPSGGDY